MCIGVLLRLFAIKCPKPIKMFLIRAYGLFVSYIQDEIIARVVIKKISTLGRK